MTDVYTEIKSATAAIVNCNWDVLGGNILPGCSRGSSGGTPVVGAKRGSLPEVVNDGKTGILVDREDPEELAEAIVSCYWTGRADCVWVMQALSGLRNLQIIPQLRLTGRVLQLEP